MRRQWTMGGRRRHASRAGGRWLAAGTVAWLTVAAAAVPARAQTAKELADRVDRLLRGNSSRGDMVMDIVTAHWSRSLEMRVWSLGTKYALVRVVSPAKEAGTATLKAGNEVWNYLPRVDRTIKVPPSLMMGSWMGSHFTNDDLVKESRVIEDYDIVFGPGTDAESWELVLTPKPEAAVVWGKIIERIRKSDLMPVWARYYDDRGTLIRTLTFSDYQRMGGRLVPATMTIQPQDKPREYTRLRYKSLEFDVKLTPDFFSLRNLRERS